MKGKPMQNRTRRWTVTNIVCPYCSKRNIIQGRNNCGQAKCAYKSEQIRYEMRIKKIIQQTGNRNY